MMPSRLHRSALKYAEHGWYVFPLAPQSKVPAIPKTAGGNGCKDATRDAFIIDHWWNKQPAWNIGIACGPRSGIYVVDIDPPHGGNETLAQLERKHGQLPTTLEATTPSGGRHILFAHPDTELGNSVGSKLGDGIDTRGAGGYIVGAPSTTKIGGYRWVNWDQTPVPMPSWLITKLRPKPSPERVPLNLGMATSLAERVLNERAEAVLHAPNQKRNHTLNNAAFALRPFVDQGAILERVVTSTLAEAARRSGLAEHEIVATIKSGLGLTDTVRR